MTDAANTYLEAEWEVLKTAVEEYRAAVADAARANLKAAVEVMKAAVVIDSDAADAAVMNAEMFEAVVAYRVEVMDAEWAHLKAAAGECDD